MKIYILALCVGLGNAMKMPENYNPLSSSQLLTGTLLKQGETEQEALEGFPYLPLERKKVNMKPPYIDLIMSSIISNHSFHYLKLHYCCSSYCTLLPFSAMYPAEQRMFCSKQYCQNRKILSNKQSMPTCNMDKSQQYFIRHFITA